MYLNRIFRIKYFLLCIMFYAFSAMAAADIDTNATIDPISAPSFEPIKNLETIAKNYALRNVALQADETADVQVNQLDANLKLPACGNNIEARLPADTNREKITAIELTCNGDKPWHTFVPVNVQILTNVLVTNKTLQAKDIVTEDDLEYSAYDKSHLLGGYYQDKNLVVGQEITQLIPAGTVLTKRSLRSPILIHKNEIIELIAQNGSILVTVKGIAKTDGRLNESIKAVNPSSDRTLDAVVIGENKAQVIG